MKTRTFSKLLLAGLLMLSSLAWANPGPEDRERIQSVIIGKFATEMDLSPQQAEQFFPRLRQYQNQLEAVQRDEKRIRTELDDIARQPNADPQYLNNLLQQRRANDQSMGVAKQEFLQDISTFLTPQQVSRCSILLDELPQRTRQIMLDKQREKSGQGKSPYRRQAPPPRRRAR